MVYGYFWVNMWCGKEVVRTDPNILKDVVFLQSVSVRTEECKL